MKGFSQLGSRANREQTCQTGQRSLNVWNLAKVSGRDTSKGLSNPGGVGLHKRDKEMGVRAQFRPFCHVILPSKNP